jgi:hypothetical protein
MSIAMINRDGTHELIIKNETINEKSMYTVGVNADGRMSCQNQEGTCSRQKHLWA